jgi:hypothetical protein
MKTIRNILAGLFVAVLALSGGNAAKAQNTKETPVKTAPSKVGKKHTPEEFFEMLDNLGFNPKFVNDKDGRAYAIDIEIPSNGVTFGSRIVWDKEFKSFYMRSKLLHCENHATLTPEMAKEMFKQNSLLNCGLLYYAEFNDGTGAVVLYYELPNDVLTPSTLRQKISDFGTSCAVAYNTIVKAEKAAAEAKAKAQAKADPKEPSVP